VRALSPELLGQVQEYVEHCPRTEEGWARLRWYRICSWAGATRERVEAAEAEERSQHRRGVEILRDIFGSLPSQLLPVAEMSWLTWNDGCVVKLATAIHEERDFSPDRMGILADALEEAGCTDEEILNHERAGMALLHRPGPDARISANQPRCG